MSAVHPSHYIFHPPLDRDTDLSEIRHNRHHLQKGGGAAKVYLLT